MQKQGYKTIDSSFYTAIEGWDSWYKGQVKDFHFYKVYNGKKFVNKVRKTLAMPKKVCEDYANLLFNEKVKITLDNEPSQKYLNNVLADNNFAVKGNESQEFKVALGTVAYVLFVKDGIEINGKVSGGKVSINYVTADKIYPLSWRNGKVINCAFGADIVSGEKKYLHLQLHKLTPLGYVIENKAFNVTDGKFDEVELLSVPGLEKVAKTVNTCSMERQFIIDRPNITNNYDKLSPMGISIFANSIDVMRGIDLVYDSYCNEFETGRKRIFVRPEMMSMDEDGVTGFDKNETTFYMMPEDGTNSSETLIKESNMNIRADEHKSAINDNLNLLSTKVGFGENYYRFDKGSVATATQVVSENSTLFRTVKKHEIILEDVLDELVYIILRLGKTVVKEDGLELEPEITIDFDDSIIEDKQAEFNRDIMLVNAGAMGVDELRSKYMNESIDDARKNLPGQSEPPPDPTME